ncbi:glycosyltransferase [Rhodobacter ferrooxidans]|uniref:Glycosyl transferase group 1 n=1 Tax=Rhodobacter ferrooxidans TaxID=371731 RepID=C8S378_9RHOB|nr:glycosyltransferase [Rhodobacter sp. SW2]EEW24560.1 glycosyl transferase group 1 [Rhodobacter sp. SW2]
MFFHEVARMLRANGHEVAMMSCAEPGLDAAGVEFFPEAVDYRNGGIIKRVLNFPGMIYNRGAKAAMARRISEFCPDIVHAFAIYVRLTPAILEAAKEAGVPVVLSCNDYKHICPNYKLFHHGKICDDCKGGHFYQALRNRCCHDSVAFSAASMVEAYVQDGLDIWRRNVHTFLFASKFMAEKTEEFWGKGRVRIDFLRNPFDVARHEITPNVGDYVLYFGRLIEEKGVDVLLEAAALAPDVPIVIVGDGPDQARLNARALGLANVRMVGPAWGDDLAQYLHGARAVVVPSLWHENFPYVILQAFAASKPVIGSSRGGIPEMIGDARGWTYQASDATALATVLRQVVQLPNQKIAEIGADALTFLREELSDDSTYERLIAIYRKALA